MSEVAMGLGKKKKKSVRNSDFSYGREIWKAEG